MPITKAVIPAAGFGTRLLPATKAQPKEMLPLVDVPIIQWAVEEAVRCGITDVLLVTSAGKQAMEDHFDAAPGLERTLADKGKDDLLERVRAITDLAEVHSVRQHEALGLGHAVGCARTHVGDEPFAVLLPDEVFPPPDTLLPSLIRAYETYGASVIAVRPMPRDEISAYGVIDPETVEEKVVRMRDFVEKPSPEEAPSTLASIGRYVLTPDVFGALERTEPGAGGEIQLTDAIRILAKERFAYACTFDGPRFDVGKTLGLLEASAELALDHPEYGEPFRAFLTDLVRRRST